ncbi:hypothetical protein TanjilG_23346 [Lupinus angustifolius]|uniref:C3H1-type domain-containing protein n=2 Tax=Lupinus angustifolius TaxID=3871 RepID=A0A4P1R9Y0_LUPAN|nr:hypothetical protein TanjilG_23346 [Lupinus angustifolius]
MGMLLIQDHGEKEMIRQSSTISASRLSGNNLPPALTIPNSTSSNSPSWATMSQLNTPDELIMSPNNFVVGSNNTSSSSLPFYHHASGRVSDPIDEFQLQDQLSFLNDGYDPLKNHDLFYHNHSDLYSSPSSGADPNLLPSYGWGGGSLHRSSSSVNNACLGSEDPNSGFGWKPCLYFARGYCKNGTSCRFLHGGGGGGIGDADIAMVGSPNKIEMMDQCHELLRSKTAQHQRLAAASQLMASSFPYSPKCMNMLLEQQQNDSPRGAVTALMMNEELHKFGRSRLERNDFSLISPEMVNPASRQIYLTFPADSTFREEDVSNYFSIYGPVQDVRIPYQQKRMFGFVTFVYPETVKLILSKGNPHFVCDARVLVKPYKEKGKVLEKKQQQQVDRVDFSPCGTPPRLDARDHFDLQLGGRMFCNTQDMLWRRKLEEQADFQQALELQSRRLMGLQLLDITKQHHRALSTGSPMPSLTRSPSMFNQNLGFPLFHSSSETWKDSGSSSDPASSNASVNTSLLKEVIGNGENGYNDGNGKSSSHEECDLQECLDHNLPDSPFASPTKAGGGDCIAAFSNGPIEAIDSDASAASSNSKFGTTTLLPSPSSLDTGSFKSFNCQIPRFSSGHGTIGMFAGTGRPIGI